MTKHPGDPPIRPPAVRVWSADSRPCNLHPVFDLLKETLAYARTSKKWWIVPLVGLLMLLAGAAVVLQGAPFLYPFF